MIAEAYNEVLGVGSQSAGEEEVQGALRDTVHTVLGIELVTLWVILAVFALLTCTALFVRRYVRTRCGVFCEVLTMEAVLSKAEKLLNQHADMDGVAVSLYDPSHLPAELAPVIARIKLPKDVHHIALLSLIKNNQSQRVVDVYLSEQVEEALLHAASDGIFVVKR